MKTTKGETEIEKTDTKRKVERNIKIPINTIIY